MLQDFPENYGVDQELLTRLIYARFKKRNEILIHDSYHCNVFKGTVPFPVQRLNSTGDDGDDDGMEFVGKQERCVHYMDSAERKKPGRYTKGKA